MRRRLAIRVAFFAMLIALAAGGIWLVVRPPETEKVESRLKPCVGRPAREVVALLKLEQAERFWTDEPPLKLRGVSYYAADGLSVTIYVAAGEPLFRRYSKEREWDYEAFLNSRVGGIQYKSNGVEVSVGPDVLWR